MHVRTPFITFDSSLCDFGSRLNGRSVRLRSQTGTWACGKFGQIAMTLTAKPCAYTMAGHGPALDPSKGVGSLRVWPGGMANARAIGDFAAGHLLLSSPYISQASISLVAATPSKII